MSDLAESQSSSIEAQAGTAEVPDQQIHGGSSAESSDAVRPTESATSINSISATSLEPDSSSNDDNASNIDSAIGSWRSS